MQLAKMMGVARPVITEAIRSGKIRAVVVEGRNMVDADEAIPALRAHTDPDMNRNGLGAGVSGDDELEGEESNEPGAPRKGSVASMREIQARYKTKLLKLEYEREVGLVVPIEVIDKRWQKIAGIVRTKILGVPSKARQRIPDLTQRMYTELEKLIYEALESLDETEIETDATDQ